MSSSRPWPSGIRFYRVPVGRAWRNPGGGIDIIHHGHRYAVVWPSIHPEGRAYEWLATQRTGANSPVPDPFTLPELPPSWVAHLDAGEARPYVEGEATASWLSSRACWPDGPWGMPCPVMVESRDRHIGQVYTGGSRHDAMNAGIAALVHLAANGHRGGKAALAALHAAFEQAVPDRSTWGEFDRSLEGALRKEGLSELFAAPPCQCGRPPDAVVTPATPATDVERLYLPRPGLKDLPRPPFIIDGVLDGGSLFSITGRDGIYKSFLGLDWLACVATGKDWFRAQVKPCRVLYVVGEGVYGLDERLNAWEAAWGRTIPADALTVRTEPVNLFRGGPAFDELVVRTVTGGYGLVLFDTLQRMSSGADIDRTKDASVVIARLDLLRRAIGTGAVGIVAHTGKSDLDTRGHSSLEDDLDIVWKLTRSDESDDDVTAELVKRKNGPGGVRHRLRPRIIAGTSSLVLEPARGAAPASGRMPKHTLEVLQMLATPVASDGLPASSLGDSIGVRGGAVYRPLNWLLGAGLVHCTKSGRTARFEITLSGRERLLSTQVSQ